MIVRGGTSRVHNRSRYLGIGLTGLTAGLAVLAVVSSLLGVRYQHQLNEASQYNTTFDYSQTATEILRLQLALQSVIDGGDPDQIPLRHDILTNRLGVILDNAFAREGEMSPTANQLQRTLETIEPLLADPANLDDLRTASDALSPLVTPILRLASRTHAEAGDIVRDNQSNLSRILGGVTLITLALVAVGMVLIGFVLHQNRRLGLIARTDALTGLANRLAFDDALRTTEGKPAAVVLVDIDHFKTINDTLGHKVGDGIITQLAGHLADAAPTPDTIARIGGDEFAAVFTGTDAERHGTIYAEQILTRMAEPCNVDGCEVKASVTIGLGVLQSSDAATLLNDADIALYAAKDEGRGRCLRFEPRMKQAFLRDQALQEAMRQATERNELSLVYQPIVNLENRKTLGFEALLRWTHPEFGPISPVEFIPIAERSGQIEAIGRWVIERACLDAARWPSNLFVAVNVSARQLLDRTFIDDVHSALTMSGLDPNRLDIEVTESTLIVNDAVVLGVVKQLKSLGCRVSLDDFGTGYASLSYLQRFPFDKIKIDQSFLRGELAGSGTYAIIAMICSLAGVLDLHIVTEGIETEHQFDAVRGAGSHYGQGYLFDRPLKLDDVLKRIAREATGHMPLVAANASAA